MEKINFEDIRVGDVIEAHRTYSGGNSSAHRFTVREKGTYYKLGAEIVYSSNNTSAEYFLVERPKPTFKVGDTITGEQVADLPDGAVFDLRSSRVVLRYKINGKVYTPQGSAISLDTYRGNDFRSLKIVSLPEA